MHSFTILLFTPFVILSNAAVASTNLSLNEALKEAGEHSPKLAKAKASAEEFGWKRTETLSGFLPNVSLFGSHYFSTRYQYTDVSLGGAAPVSVPNIIPNNTLGVNISLPLFDGFMSVHRYKASGLERDAAENEYTWARFQLEHDIKLKYYQVLAARQLRDVSEQNVKTLQDHFNQIQNLKRGGAATNYDVLRVEVQLHEAQSEILNSEDNYVMARKRLALAMGEESDGRDVIGDLPEPVNPSIEGLRLDDLRDRGDLKAQTLRSQATSEIESGAGNYLIPKVSLGYQLYSYNNRNGNLTDYDNYRTADQFGLFLTWTLFDGMQSIARSNEAYYQKIQAEKALEQSKLQAPVDLEFWQRRYLYSASLYKAKKSDIEKAQESVRLSKEAFRAGVRTSSDVLDAELDLIRARAGAVNSQLNCAEALINIELGLGRTLQ